MSQFVIYPAIDLRDGRVVRLKQGRAADETVYATDAVETAREWARQGAEWLHIVNLDGAFGQSTSPNLELVKRIAAAVDVPIQFGGGLRTLAELRRAFELGVRRAVIGTAAVEQPELVSQALAEFGAERIAVGMDARDGKLATHGWESASGVEAREFGKQLCALGVRRAIVTDIARDGMLEGVDAGAMADYARTTGLQVIASGGVARLEDVRNLVPLTAIGVEGVIIGKALYSGAFQLRDALAVVALHASRTRQRICEG